MQGGSSVIPCLKTRPENPTLLRWLIKGSTTVIKCFAWEDLSAEERYEKRQSELKPLLEKFSDWCSKKSISVLPSGKLGIAFQYCIKHMDKFMNVLKDGRLELSNNRAERAVKKIVMGRKNWLFSQSSTGAKSMAIIMSILETAKQNGLDQFKYINYLLDKLPNELSLLDTQRL